MKSTPQDRLDEYEVSAIYDDAGTPPRGGAGVCTYKPPVAKGSEEFRRMQRRQKRREQLDRFDLWLREFRRDHPIGYVLLSLGCGLVFGVFTLAAIELLDRLSR